MISCYGKFVLLISYLMENGEEGIDFRVAIKSALLRILEDYIAREGM